MYVSVFFFLVDFIPCNLMCRRLIVVFINFFICKLINPYVRIGNVLITPRLISTRMIVVVRIKNAARKYCAASGLVVQTIILFTTIFYCCVLRGASHIPVCLFLIHFNIYCPFFGLAFLFGIV